MKKLNCWELKKCGREPDGKNVHELGTCPAALSNDLDGINSGKSAGRICWQVSGTYCNGKICGTYASKSKSCLQCDFLQIVMYEEGVNFELRANNMS